MGEFPTAIGLTAGAIWFAAFVAGHVVGLRWGRATAGAFIRAYAAAGLGLVVTLCLLGPHLPGLPALILALAHGCLTYACLFVLYVPFFYTITSSLSVETLILLQRNGGEMDEGDLYRRFAGFDFAQGRLDVLHRSRYLELSDQRYQATSRGRAVADFFAAIKSLWRLGPGG